MPSATLRWIVSPGTTIGLDASGSSDTDGDALSFEWEGARQDRTNTAGTFATLKVDKDAEDGTVLSVTVTVTDNSRGMLTGSASIEFLVVDDNTVPDSSTGSRDDCADAEVTGESPVCAGIRSAQGGSGAGIQYITSDGAQGGDMKNGKPTGRVTFRGVGFDPDQPVGTLIYAWSELTTDAMKTNEPGAIDSTTGPGNATVGDNPAAVVDPDEAVLELEGAFTDTVSFDVPEVDATTTVILAFSVIDQHGVAGTSTATITILATDSDPAADAGSDQIVEPESFVRLNGGGSSDPDKDDSIASHSWALTGVSTSPATTEVLKSVADTAVGHTVVLRVAVVEQGLRDGELIGTIGVGVIQRRACEDCRPRSSRLVPDDDLDHRGRVSSGGCWAICGGVGDVQPVVHVEGRLCGSQIVNRLDGISGGIVGAQLRRGARLAETFTF